MKKIILITLLGFFYSQNVGAANHFSIAKVTAHLPIPQLGVGYSDDMQIVLGMSCLKPGKIEFAGGTKAVITLGKSYNFDEIQKELNTDVTADVKIDLFSFDAKTSYARYIKNTKYSESFFYLEKILLPTQIMTTDFGTLALNSFGKAAYEAGPAQFRISCGNKFHQQMAVGVNFITTFKLIFNSAFDKSTFNASAGASIGDFVSAKTTIQKIVTQKNIRGAMEISAYQEGGDPAQLAKIFAKCTDHYCITACSFDNLEACQGTIDGIINYSQNDLPKEIDYNPETKQILGTVNPLFYEYMDYTQLGLNNTDSDLTSDIIAARKELGSLYKETLNNEDIVDHILNSQVAASIIKEYKEKLLELSEALHTNASLLASNFGAIGCYLNPNKCVTIQKNIHTLLKPIDASILRMFKIGFIDRRLEGPYLVTPIGGNQYQYYSNGGSRYVAQATIKFINNAEILHTEGIDIYSERFVCDAIKIGDGTYMGDMHYERGRSVRQQVTIVENPI